MYQQIQYRQRNKNLQQYHQPKNTLDNPPTKEVIVAKDTLITDRIISVMKTEIIRERKEAIIKATLESTKATGTAVASAKSSAIKCLHTEYEAILEYLLAYDTAKEELVLWTKPSIEEIMKEATTLGISAKAVLQVIIKIQQDLDDNLKNQKIVSRSHLLQEISWMVR